MLVLLQDIKFAHCTLVSTDKQFRSSSAPLYSPIFATPYNVSLLDHHFKEENVECFKTYASSYLLPVKVVQESFKKTVFISLRTHFARILFPCACIATYMLVRHFQTTIPSTYFCCIFDFHYAVVKSLLLQWDFTCWNLTAYEQQHMNLFDNISATRLAHVNGYHTNQLTVRVLPLKLPCTLHFCAIIQFTNAAKLICVALKTALARSRPP